MSEGDAGRARARAVARFATAPAQVHGDVRTLRHPRTRPRVSRAGDPRGVSRLELDGSASFDGIAAVRPRAHHLGAGRAALRARARPRLAPLDKVSRAPILAPIAGIILNLDEAEERAAALEGTEPTPRDSIRAELARTRADVSQLEYLCDFPWKDHFAAEDSSSGRLERLKDFVRRVKHSRAQVELEEERDDARDIPEEFVDPIMQTIMTDPVMLPGSGQIVDRATIREAPARRSDRSIQSVAAGREHARAGGRTARANRTVAEGGAGRCAEPGGCGLGRRTRERGGEPGDGGGREKWMKFKVFPVAVVVQKVGTVF